MRKKEGIGRKKRCMNVGKKKVEEGVDEGE